MSVFVCSTCALSAKGQMSQSLYRAIMDWMSVMVVSPMAARFRASTSLAAAMSPISYRQLMYLFHKGSLWEPDSTLKARSKTALVLSISPMPVKNRLTETQEQRRRPNKNVTYSRTNSGQPRNCNIPRSKILTVACCSLERNSSIAAAT